MAVNKKGPITCNCPSLLDRYTFSQILHVHHVHPIYAQRDWYKQIVGNRSLNFEEHTCSVLIFFSLVLFLGDFCTMTGELSYWKLPSGIHDGHECTNPVYCHTWWASVRGLSVTAPKPLRFPPPACFFFFFFKHAQCINCLIYTRFTPSTHASTKHVFKWSVIYSGSRITARNVMWNKTEKEYSYITSRTHFKL